MSEETKIQNQDEETRIQEFNPAAPVSQSKIEKAGLASRLGFGIGGFVAGAAVGFGVSSMAAGSSADSGKIDGLAPDSTLTEGATPEAELTDVEPDSTLSARERTNIDDPYELPNNIQETNPVNEVAAVTEVTVDTQLNREGGSQIVSDNNPVSGGPVKMEAPEVVIEGTNNAMEVTVTDENITVAIPDVEIEEADLTVPNQMDAMLVNEHGLHIAHVDDDMSFAQAFAAARSQVGAGGVFEWHGSYYGTYYEEEWNMMDTSDRADYMAKVDFPQDTPVPPMPELDPEIVFLGLSNHELTDGQTVTAASLTINGHQVALLDEDGDGVFDNAYIDVDGNEEFDPSADMVISLEDAGLTVSDMALALEEQNMYEDPYLTETDVIDDVSMMEMGDDIAMNDFSNDSIPDF